VQLTMSAVIILGVMVFLLVRKSGLKVFHALVAAMFGFYLASTSLAGRITSVSDTVASLLGSLHF
jgi:hypothetical protein